MGVGWQKKIRENPMFMNWWFNYVPQAAPKLPSSKESPDTAKELEIHRQHSVEKTKNFYSCIKYSS